MNHFPHLQSLTDVEEIFLSLKSDTAYSETIVVALQHLLETTGSLIESIIRFGIKPENVFVVGKKYSNNVEVIDELIEIGVNVVKSEMSFVPGFYNDSLMNDINKLWDRVLRSHTKDLNYILLDEGGYLHDSVPSELSSNDIVGIEQTTYGLKKLLNVSTQRFSTINVAGSFIKTSIEPALVAHKIVEELNNFGIDNEVKIGIIGMGNIGKAIYHRLRNQGYRLTNYDNEKRNLIDDVVVQSDVIIGATGVDISKPKWISNLTNKTYVSVSSADIEFNAIIRNAIEQDPFMTINLSNQNRVIRGGFPINFNQERQSVKSEHIQLTRALLLTGFCQSIDALNRSYVPGIIELDNLIQRMILEKWRMRTDKSEIDNLGI